MVLSCATWATAGRWWDEQRQVWRDGRGRKVPSPALAEDDAPVRTTKVVLAAAHLDQVTFMQEQFELETLARRFGRYVEQHPTLKPEAARFLGGVLVRGKCRAVTQNGPAASRNAPPASCSAA